MGREQRRSPRVEIGLAVCIIIRDNSSGATLAEAGGLINDISRHGLRLTVPQAKVGEYHLFYGFHDNEGQTIHLTARDEAGGDELPRFSMPVHPVWFDRMLTQPDKPFQLGMEFLEELPPGVTRWLQDQMTRRQKTQGGGWLSRLFGS